MSSKGYLVAAGVVLFGCVLLAQSRDTARSQQKRARRDAESLYSNIYSAIAEFTANDAAAPVGKDNMQDAAEDKMDGGNVRTKRNRLSGGGGNSNFAALQAGGAVQLPRGSRQAVTGNFDNVITDGFPTGLPAGTPLGVKIALASTQQLSDDEMPPIPGVAGVDFPVLTEIPQTGFDCAAQDFPGIYADMDTDCQVFYMCQPNGNFNSFLCPNGTVFNQQYFICDWWYNFDCGTAANFYELNQFLYEDVEPAQLKLGDSNDYNY